MGYMLRFHHPNTTNWMDRFTQNSSQECNRKFKINAVVVLKALVRQVVAVNIGLVTLSLTNMYRKAEGWHITDHVTANQVRRLSLGM
mmetsp:Transcript_13649/g.26090  ORF Transcript_13649/g.26090 Transcript_13649/m.26090 type:complete len:87 (-) Transcript_13649:194-454(-)